jgi:hypothetical protein
LVALRRAIEQPPTEVQLKLSDQTARVLLCHMKPACGSRKICFFRCGDKHTQVLLIHAQRYNKLL